MSDHQSEVLGKPPVLSESKQDLAVTSGSQNSRQTFSSTKAPVVSESKQDLTTTSGSQNSKQTFSGSSTKSQAVQSKPATTSASTTGQQAFPRPGYKLMGYPPVEVPITDDIASQADSAATQSGV